MNPLNNQPNITSLYQKFMQNPAQALMQSGFKLSGDTSNPQSIIQQLLNSGQITQAQLNNAQQAAMRFSQMFKR